MFDYTTKWHNTLDLEFKILSFKIQNLKFKMTQCIFSAAECRTPAAEILVGGWSPREETTGRSVFCIFILRFSPVFAVFLDDHIFWGFF